MTPRRRRQPGSGATRSESVFPTKREGPARGCSRHAMVAEALVPPDAARDAIRIATRVAIVYTNAPKRPREARSSHLCTLLRSQGHPQPKPTAQQCTQMPQNGTEGPFSSICVHYCVLASVHNSATAQQCTQTPQNGAERPDPPICVHYCDPKATHNPSPRPNSVHKRSNPVRRGPILPFVYTIAIPRPPTTQAHGATVYTNAPKRRRGGHFHRSVYTLCRHPGGEAHAVLAVTPTPPGR